MLPTADLLNWFLVFGRSYPWRFTLSPYKVLVSEILLQQTNAEKVVNPYSLIVERYPTIQKLAEADDDVFLKIFSKLGLFFRAKRLKAIAWEVIDRFDSVIPSNLTDLKSITGIGDYTANAVLCFGYGFDAPIVDTNIIRIFNRYGLYSSSMKRPRTDKALWIFATSILPNSNVIKYNYALLDLGALICTSRKPRCEICPIKKACSFFIDGQ